MKNEAEMRKEIDNGITRMKAMNINIDDLTQDQIRAFVNYNNLPYGPSFVSRLLTFVSIPIIGVALYELFFGSKLKFAILLAAFLITTGLSYASQYLYFKKRVLIDIQNRKNLL